MASISNSSAARGANDGAQATDGEEDVGTAEEAMEYPDQGPPLTQQSQDFEANEAEEEGEATSEESEDDETPLAVAAKKIKQMRLRTLGLTTTKDSPIMVAAAKLKTLKQIMDSEKQQEKTVAEEQALEMEDAKRKTVKKEMQQRIDKGKMPMQTSQVEPRRSTRLFQKTAFSKFTNTEDNPVVIDEAEAEEDTLQTKEQSPPVQINSYTGPMKLGKKKPPPVKQFKTIVGQTELKSAPFLSHGRNVITKSSLAKALSNLKKTYLPGSIAKEKDTQQP
uniref:Uncharacterized protein n=1 Tax=Daucus carota subsp. sativus TaxID=79200 RepID=A0A166AZA0_DAUCS